MNEELNKQQNGTEEEPVIITLTDPSGKEYDATLLTCFPAGALNRNYVAVMPHVPDNEGNFNIQIFRYSLSEKDGQEGMEISEIGSDMEFEEAKKVLESLIDED